MCTAFANDRGESHALRFVGGCGRASTAIAIATFGIAALLISNPLAGQGASPKAAGTALAALEQGRGVGAKTQRERDYIEAVAAYYADFANAPVVTRAGI